MNAKGYLALVLHAHLPFVRHPEYEDFLEEDWLYEAITETYLPLLSMMERLQRDGVPWRLTMSLSPTLCSMLADPLLQERYVQHLQRLLQLSDREVERTASLHQFHDTALMYQRRFRECWGLYVERYQRNLLAAFKRFMDLGCLEIITCGATHGYMPLMQHRPEAADAQVAVAVDHYRAVFGTQPKGIWNAECAYYPGLEEILARHDLCYFFLDSHGVLFASKRPKYGVFAPLRTPAGVHAFGRDMPSSRAVWSAQAGYPGDFRYREFYRDIGYDLDMDYIRPFIHEDGIRLATGIKYYRITGHVPLHSKAPYDERSATEAAATHAGHFLFARQNQVLHLQGLIDRPALITAPYDAELFGHWWYEGPQFLEFLIRKIHHDQEDIQLITPSEYLELYPDNQTALPSLSSWGQGGYNAVWLEGSNDWIYRHLDEAAARMNRLADSHSEPDELTRRALNQCARELLLAQASDWAFIMKTKTTVDYAVKRTKDHLNQFFALEDMINAEAIDDDYLAELEWRDNIFGNLDYRVYCSQALPAARETGT